MMEEAIRRIRDLMNAVKSVTIFEGTLDGNTAIHMRDLQKEEICREHGFQLIRVDNTYARRYNHIKIILEKYFKQLT